MKRPIKSNLPRSDRGVSIIDLLIVTTVIAVAISLILPLALSAQRSLVRANAVQEFSGFVQHARSDSKKLTWGAKPRTRTNATKPATFGTKASSAAAPAVVP